MKTIALRFSENIAPPCGTIAAHEELIGFYSFVWYGKFGAAISKQAFSQILENKEPKILLIHSGGIDRYWAYITDISYTVPPIQFVPEYYHSERDIIHTWFKVNRFEKASKDVMSHCTVLSSGEKLSLASKFSMSPYFKIEFLC